MKDLYEILDIDKNSSQEDIKAKYKKMAVENHPDKESGDNNKMTEINRAYKVLGNPNSMSRYDQTGQEGEAPFDQKFMGLVNQIFGVVMESADADTQDIMDVFRSTIKEMKNNCTTELKKFNKKLSKAKNIRKRISTKKSKIIISVIEINIRNMEQHIFMLKEEDAFFDKAVIVMRDYNYEYDKEKVGGGGFDIEGLFNDEMKKRFRL